MYQLRGLPPFQFLGHTGSFMLLLTNDDVENLISIPDCVAALEDAYRDYGNEDAVDMPRQDMLVANSRAGAVHAFKTMSGSWPRVGIAAVRLSSDIVTWPVTNGAPRRVKVPLSEPGGRYNGSLLLFSTETGQLLCMMSDGVVQKMRVGCTSGVAAKYLARKGSRVMCLFGAGWQAEGHLEAMCAVRRFDRINVYSPNPSSRKKFVERFRAKLKVNIIDVATPAAAVEGADILISATNSMLPTIGPEWIGPGMHIASVRGSEIPISVLNKVTRLVVHSTEPVAAFPARGWPSEVPEFANGDYSRPDVGQFDLSNVPELKDVVAGKSVGRQSDDEVTCFHNFKGLGLQFAVVGSLVYREAVKRKLGHLIDDSYFTQTVHP
jgi:ornithine cyclodeaminase/alanine dehydrogenase-like protein (mu-crystallin family)